MTTTIIQGTGLQGDGTPTEETFTCNREDFAADQGFEPDDPDLLRVLALQPGEETVLDCGAGGAWRIRCVAQDKPARPSFTGSDAWPQAFDYCREVGHPVTVSVLGARWKLFPSGRAEARP